MSDNAVKTPLDLDLIPEAQEAGLPAHRSLTPGAVSLKIEASTLSDPEGAVRGAFWIGNHRGDAPTEVYLLQDGDVVAAPAGSAALVQTPEGWKRCDFAEEGRLVGPLVYSAVPGRSGSELLHLAGNGIREASVVLASMVVIIGAAFPLAVLGDQIAGRDGALVGIAVWMAGLAWSLFGKEDYLTKYGPVLAEKLTILNPKAKQLSQRKLNLSVTLSDRVRHLAGYSPVVIETRMPHHETDEIDEEIHQAETSYRARRRELYSQGGSVPQHKSLDYVSGQLSAFSQRIQESPRLLRSREIRSAYLGLLRRAEEDVATVIERRAAAEHGDLLADLSALSQQMDTYKP